MWKSQQKEQEIKMYYVGIDIGSTASKVVVRGEKELHFVLPTGWSSKETLKEQERSCLGFTAYCWMA